MNAKKKWIIGISAGVGGLLLITAVVLLVIFLGGKGADVLNGTTGRLLTSNVPAELWWHANDECEECEKALQSKKEKDNIYSTDYINVTNVTGDIFANAPVGADWQPGEFRVAFLEIKNTGTTDMKYNLMSEVTYPEGATQPAGFKYVFLKNMTYKECVKAGYADWNSFAKINESEGTISAGSGILALDVTVPVGKSSYVAVVVYYDGKSPAAYSGMTFDIKLFCNSIPNEGNNQKVFYVSPDGHDGNPGTEAAPLKSFRRAAQLAKPGETYIFEDGYYYEGGMTVMMNSGTADAPIIFKARNPREAHIIYPEVLSGNHKIYIYQKEYITIEGFELTQEKMAEDSNPNAKLDMIIRCASCNNITIRNNEIHHALEEPLKMSRGHNIIIEENYIHDSGYEGIDSVNLSDSIYRNNIIEEVGRFAIMCKGGSRSNLFYNNYIHTRERTMENAIGIGGLSNNTSIWGGTTDFWEAFNVYAFNNVIVADNPGKIIKGLTFLGARDSGAFNNILVGCNYGVEYRVPDDMNYGWEWNPTNLNIIFKNNVIMDSQIAACIYVDGDPINLDSDYNLYYNNAGTDPVEHHSIYNKDPGFVASKSDWNLKEDSPLKGAGTPISGLVGLSGESFFAGFDKNFILRGDTWDIGVYDTDGTQSYDPGGIIFNDPAFRNEIDYTIYEAPTFSSMPEKGTELMKEEFKDTGALGNMVESSNSKGRWTVRGGTLTMDSVTGRVTARYKTGLTWSDYEYSAKVLSPSMTDLDNCSGIIFRADDEMKNMYALRFLPGAVTNKLEFCMWNSGAFASLKIVPYEWEPSRMYELKVVAIGDNFSFYIEDVNIFTAIDGSHPMGTVGVYSYRESHLFDDMQVFSAKGDSIVQLPDPEPIPEYTGTILMDETFFDKSVLADWKAIKGEWKIMDEKMTEVGGPVASGDRRIVYTKGYDWKNYEVWVDVYMPENAGHSPGILFSYNSDGTKYYGFRIVNNNVYIFNENGKLYVEPIAGHPSGEVARMKAIVEDDKIRVYLNTRKLWEQEDVETTPGTIGLYLNGSCVTNYFDNIEVYEIESKYTGTGGSTGGSSSGSSSSNVPAYKPDYTGTILLEKDFNSKDELTDWFVVDEAGKRESNWEVVGGVLKDTIKDPMQGSTMIVYKNGNWNRYEFGVDVKLPEEPGSVGVVFGSDAAGKNYYYFRIFYNGQAFFKYLYKVTPHGTETLVREVKAGNFNPGDKVRLTLFVENKNLKIYIGSNEAYSGEKLSGLKGTIGLFLRGAVTNNAFDNLKVKELNSIANSAPLLEKDFSRPENMTFWFVKDETGKRQSNWQVVDGVMKETSDATTDITNGFAFLVYTAQNFTDYEYSVDVQLPTKNVGVGSKSAGVAFGFDEAGKYYYYLRIFMLGNDYYYQIVQSDAEGKQNVVPQEKINGQIEAGSVARITVYAADAQLKVYINDILLYSGMRPGLAGHIGLYLSGDMPNNAFDNIVVRRAVTDDDLEEEEEEDNNSGNTGDSDNTGDGGSTGDGGNTGDDAGYKPSYTGSTLLNQDFENQSDLTDWFANDDNNRLSNWQIIDGVLAENSDASVKNGTSMLIYQPGTWTHYEYSVDMKLPEAAGSVGVVFGSDATGTSYYYLRIFYNGSGFYKYIYKVTPQGSETIVREVKLYGLNTGATINIKVIVEGDSLKIFLNNKETYTGENMSDLNGTIGLYLRGNVPGNAFDNLIVKEITGNIREVTYTITYKNTGTTTNPNPTTYTANGAAGITLQAPGSITGYTFEGWYLNDQKITNLAGQTGNLVIEARWKNAGGDYVELPSVGIK